MFMQGQFNGLWEFEWRSRENEQQSRKRNGKEKIEKLEFNWFFSFCPHTNERKIPIG